VWVPPALKRDVKKLAAAESLPISRFCCGLLRLGIGRYFELADERMAAPLRAAMRDAFGEDEWLPRRPPAQPRRPPPWPVNPERRRLNQEFNEAIEEGKRRFETARR